MIEPPLWSKVDLDASRQQAEEYFRQGRHTEPLDLYLDIFDEYQGVVEEFLEQTVDLTRLDQHAHDLVTDKRKLEVFRYLTGPPVSLDDLKVLLQTKSLSRKHLAKHPDLIPRLVEFVHSWHDRRRFPWLADPWEPEEPERQAAILATTALLAMRRLETMRRNDGKEIQERLVAEKLKAAGFNQVKARTVPTLSSAPASGAFCSESHLGNRKADFIVRLWDDRVMPLECKVSNSTTNSTKRLNNDAAVKAVSWRRDFGESQVTPAAVLSGCFSLSNLEDAQRRGLTLFWAHDLEPMLRWIESTRLKP